MASAIGTMLNCTPQTLNVYDLDGDGVEASYAPSGHVAKPAQAQKLVGTLRTETGNTLVLCSPPVFGDVEGLPPHEEGKCPDIIVSALVGQALQKSNAWAGGVYSADEGGGAVRDEKDGRIIGTKWLIEYSPPDLKRGM